MSKIKNETSFTVNFETPEHRKQLKIESIEKDETMNDIILKSLKKTNPNIFKPKK